MFHRFFRRNKSVRAEVDSINPIAPDYEFTVEGKRYKLRFDFTAIAVFESSMGFNPIVRGIGTEPMTLIVLLYVGLLANHPDITLDQVQSWFTSITAAPLYSIVLKAFRGSIPEAEDGAAKASADPMTA